MQKSDRAIHKRLLAFMKQKLLEADIQRQCLDYLKLNKIFHFRQNTGMFLNKNDHYYRFGELGCPDIICVMGGTFIGLEIKSENGRQSIHQLDFQKRLEKAGGIYVIIRSLDDLINTFRVCKKHPFGD